MSFVKVSSSQLHSCQYDPVEQKLRVRFRCRCSEDPECPKCGGSGHNSEYEYPGVSVEKWTQIRDAKNVQGGSVGGSFHRLIKSQPKIHPHTRIR